MRPTAHAVNAVKVLIFVGRDSLCFPEIGKKQNERGLTSIKSGARQKRTYVNRIVLATMPDDRIREEIIGEFFFNTCQLGRRVNDDDVRACRRCIEIAGQKFRRADDVEYGYVPLLTGSVPEFYIEPMLSCVGDVDVMCHRSNQLAIPAGYTPPRQLPGEFGSHVEVYEIVNSEFPGYVYLWLSYLLKESVDDGKYNAVQCERLLAENGSSDADDSRHGPALINGQTVVSVDLGLRQAGSQRFVDNVFCMRCLLWPPQAADWPTRHRTYGWPDSATIGRVVSNGCDVVGVAHRLCRQDEWTRKRQWRLSFSRGEIVLLNSWMPIQQIVYHMLRIFVKIERLTASANNSRAGTLSNYHIKTLMLWACELKSRSWWTDDLNLVRICVELLHALAVWLTDAHCQHYFINSCNCFDQFENPSDFTANRLMSINRALFCEWCIHSYMYQCSEFCPGSVSSLLQYASFMMPHDGLHRVVCLQNAVSAIVEWRRDISQKLTFIQYIVAQWKVIHFLPCFPLTLRSCLCWVDAMARTYKALSVCLTAVVFLHGAYKTTHSSLTDEMLDVLAATCLQLNDVRRCLNARHSSVLSLSQAAVLMKFVASNSRSTVQLIEIELSKAYLYRSLTCKDSDSNSIYCVANVYLSVLYCITGQYQTAIDHCALVTRLQNHSQCSSHVVQGELLPRIDDEIDNILGLAVFYQYILTAALNEEQERRHVSCFTTELFAHYLRIKLSSFRTCHQLPQRSLAGEIRRYQNCLCNSPELFVSDAMIFRFASRTKYPSNIDRLVMADSDRGETKSPMINQLDTSTLVELLQQAATEHLARCRELEARDFDSFVTPDFKALYAYKRGQYQHCLQLSVRNVLMLIVNKYHWCLFLWMSPELIQLMDDDIVSLIGLSTLLNRSPSSNLSLVVFIHQLSLSLYLITRCQIKLRHSATSVATTLDYVQLARSNSGRMFEYVIDRFGLEAICTVDQHVLKFVEQMILRYMSVNR